MLPNLHAAPRTSGIGQLPAEDLPRRDAPASPFLALIQGSSASLTGLLLHATAAERKPVEAKLQKKKEILGGQDPLRPPKDCPSSLTSPAVSSADTPVAESANSQDCSSAHRERETACPPHISGLRLGFFLPQDSFSPGDEVAPAGPETSGAVAVSDQARSITSKLGAADSDIPTKAPDEPVTNPALARSPQALPAPAHGPELQTDASAAVGTSSSAPSKVAAVNGAGAVSGALVKHPESGGIPAPSLTSNPDPTPAPQVQISAAVSGRELSSVGKAPFGDDAFAVGMASAQLDSAMENGQNMLKFARSGLQKLPMGGETARREDPAGTEAAPRCKSDLAGVPLAVASAVSPSSPAALQASATMAAPSPGEPRLEALQRTHDLIALHAVSLRQTGADLLRVVLQPGAGIHLSLELRQSEDGVRAQAVLHRGDFHFLAQHWPELQRRLDAAGVRLAVLERGASFTAGDPPFQQQPRNRSSEHAETGSAFADFALTGSVTQSPPPASHSRHRGWESWA